MTNDLPTGWIWASVTRLKREYVRADQIDAPYASTHERHADLDASYQHIAEEAAAIMAAQRAVLERHTEPKLQANQFDMFAGLAPSQLAIVPSPTRSAKSTVRSTTPNATTVGAADPIDPIDTAANK